MESPLKEIRLKKKMTSEQVADKVGISIGYYSLIENGKRQVSYRLAYKISSLFGKKPDDIFLQNYFTERK